MIVMLIAAVLAMQGGSGDPRSAYVSCLSDAVVNAKSASVTLDGFAQYAHQTCSKIEDGFRKKLVAFNVKNGMSKNTAVEDAQLQLEDYVYSAEERYRYSLMPPQ